MSFATVFRKWNYTGVATTSETVEQISLLKLNRQNEGLELLQRKIWRILRA